MSGENSGFSIRIYLNPLWHCFCGLKINSEVEFLVSLILLCFHDIYFWLNHTLYKDDKFEQISFENWGGYAPSKLTSINCVSVFDGTEN